MDWDGTENGTSGEIVQTARSLTAGWSEARTRVSGKVALARASRCASASALSSATTRLQPGLGLGRTIAARYADAIERGDADTLVSMLTEDATWSMPPIPTWFCGHQPVREFLVRYPLTERWKHRPARANGQLAVGCYLFDQDNGRYLPAVLDVLTLAGEKIAAVTGFLTASALERPPAATRDTGAEVFARFGLPAELA